MMIFGCGCRLRHRAGAIVVVAAENGIRVAFRTAHVEGGGEEEEEEEEEAAVTAAMNHRLLLHPICLHVVCTHFSRHHPCACVCARALLSYARAHKQSKPETRGSTPIGRPKVGRQQQSTSPTEIGQPQEAEIQLEQWKKQKQRTTTLCAPL